MCVGVRKGEKTVLALGSIVCVDRPPPMNINNEDVEFALVMFIENPHTNTKHVEVRQDRFATFWDCEAFKREIANEMNRIRFQQGRWKQSKTAAWDDLPHSEKMHYSFENHEVLVPLVVKTKAEIEKEKQTKRKNLPRRRKRGEQEAATGRMRSKKANTRGNINDLRTSKRKGQEATRMPPKKACTRGNQDVNDLNDLAQFFPFSFDDDGNYVDDDDDSSWIEDLDVLDMDNLVGLEDDN